MDPVCSCGKKIDSRRDFNVEEISGGVGDKGYDIAVIYCEHCGVIFGTMPSKKMLKKYGSA